MADLGAEPPRRNRCPVVFFLGAGASIKAGVPDTSAFVTEFLREGLHDPDAKRLATKVVEVVTAARGPLGIDVEVLLETLQKLDEKDKDILLHFFTNAEFILDGYPSKQPLVAALKDYIRQKCVVPADKVRYFDPLLGFLQDGPIDVITLNYDICIEQFCNAHKLSYQDGFDVYWNPQTFQDPRTDIRLYKLHGSVMWYRTDDGVYIKLPVRTDTAKVALITGESATGVILYPARKWDYAEPLLALMVDIKKRLESEEVKVLVVAGYSFRDDHIRNLLWDVARQNRDMQVVLIGPNAHADYEKRLMFLDDAQEKTSPLKGRVLCLPYKFESVLPSLRKYYIPHLLSAWHAEKIQKQLGPGEASWTEAILEYGQAEHAEKLEELRELLRPDEAPPDRARLAEVALRLWINSTAHSASRTTKYSEEFREFIWAVFHDGMRADFTTGPPKVKVGFAASQGQQGYTVLSGTRGWVDQYLRILTDGQQMLLQTSPLIDAELRRLRMLRQYLGHFQDDGIDFEAYFKLRRKTVDVKVLASVSEIERELDVLTVNYTVERQDRVQELIIGTEKILVSQILAV